MSGKSLFLKKVIMVLTHYRKFGMAGIRLLFNSLYGKPGKFTFKHRKLLHPIYLRNKTSDIPTFSQCILQEHYKVPLDFDPKVIFDLGANIGLSTVYFKTRWPASKVFCVEPDEGNYQLLLENTKEFEGIKCFNNGIWDKETNLIVENIENAGNWGFTVRETDEESGIQAVTIESILESQKVSHVDLLKIDIEGSELEIFSSNCKYWLEKTSVLVIELHDRLKPGSAKAFFTALQPYDYSIKTLGESLICYMNRLDRPKTTKMEIFK